MIRKLFCVALLSFAALSLFSCKDDEVVEEKFLHVYDSTGAELTEEGISFDNAGGTATLRILANADWELIVPSEASWLTVTPQTASANCDITVSARENLSTDTRSAKVEVMFGGEKISDLVVKQDGAVPQLDITASATTVVAKGGDITFDIVSNVTWSYTVTPPQGVTEVSKSADKLVLRFAESTDVDPKNFDVVFTGKSLEKTVTIKQNGNNPTLDVTASAQTIYWVGADVTFDIDTNVPWTYAIAPATDAVKEVSKAGDKLVLGFPEISATEAQNFTVTFSYGADKTKTVAIKQNGKFKKSSIVADLLDVEFAADGTAKDVSPMNLSIKSIIGTKCQTFFSETYNRYVPKFDYSIGLNISNAQGFYDIDYSENADFIAKMSDGCTLETVMMMATAPETEGKNEIKWFSSMESGGIGFLLPKTTSDPNVSITFLPNVSTTGKSTWRWTCSGVKPEVGVYYHVVGVWNKEEGKSYVYINGELKAEAEAPGDLVLAKDGSKRFLIGGDPTTTATTLQAAWNGDVPVVRMYDKPLTAAEVAELYSVLK